MESGPGAWWIELTVCSVMRTNVADGDGPHPRAEVALETRPSSRRSRICH